jgi:acetyl esterase/lipase
MKKSFPNNFSSWLFVLAGLLLASQTSQAQEKSDPLAPWKKGVKVGPVSSQNQHSIHSYFNTCPESPDGRWVLFYASTDPTGHEGEIRVVERASKKEKVLARNVVVEDAHRAACQQWVCGGKQIVFHNLLKTGEWLVMGVDLESGKERVLARNRQVGFGQPQANLVPLYGPHNKPGDHRDLELLHVDTGEIHKTPVTTELVKKTYPDWLSKQFGDGPYSIYIPMLSPDLKKVFFKMATSLGGDLRSREASKREGLLCYDLQNARFLFQHDKWGHPAWHPDSRHIINVPGIVIDSTTGKSQPIPNCPKLPGSHPSFSPDGKLFTSDAFATTFGGTKGSWVVGVGDVLTGEFSIVQTFDNSKGAQSWRVSHPHPVFSADGQRLYFNVNATQWTQLYVAEIAQKTEAKKAKDGKALDPVAALAAKLEPTRKVVYKKVGEQELRLHIFEPKNFQPTYRRPCFLAIHGGGWVGGEPRRFYPFADHFAKLGMVGISMEYRLAKPSTGITPFDCVKDGRSAVRYLRSHAAELGIDPQKIIVSGGSAGGHVAVGTALFDGLDGTDEDTQISSVPNALVLYYPVIDTSKEGYGNARCGPRWQEISPLHRVKADVPPTILFHGTGDTVTPFQGAKLFQEAMRKAGNRCELVVNEGGKHGYFLYDQGLFEETMQKTADFLESLGFLKPRK